MSSKKTCLAILAVAMLIFVAEVEVGSAVTCNPLQLSPCAAAITSSGKPSAACCSKLKEQRPCLCQYMKNPNLQKFIKSPGAKKVSSACRIPYPKC
ncbi:Bifunctional inhibitor/lipid-transfer protein/seed storage 2S albumin superfamily protein [Perilla frutescens var. frutescens]|nr:Bifunctional inhibitor/lipid-transfer protein/seed storage 2S albumin superfamily protein [Perilla frutescens var. frutescens]